jgi:G:T-mismatch repair DNA endonuclease (very short patch repair protein)
MKPCDKRLHFHSCGKNSGLSEKDYTYSCLRLSFPSLRLNDKRKIEFLYLKKKFSPADFRRLFGIFPRRFHFLLSYFEIPVRGIKEANSLEEKKSKTKSTVKRRYGAENVLSRGTEFFHDRNKTVKERYGVGNVFQLEDVKRKINRTCLKRYGRLRLTNPEAISSTRQKFSKEKWGRIAQKLRETRRSWTEERKQRFRERRGEITREFWKGVHDEFLSGKFLSRKNKLEELVSKALDSLGIEHTFSKFVARRQFDFFIPDREVLIEVQGDFWHANPLIYSCDDKLDLPGRRSTPALEIWKNDEEKRKLAESYGYRVVYLWEKDIRGMTEDDLKGFVLGQFNSLSSSSPVSSSTLT